MTAPALRSAATYSIGGCPEICCRQLRRYTAPVNRNLRRRIMALSLRSKATLTWRLFRDPDVPLAARALLPLLGLYLAVPFDIVPDFIPLLGQLDDVLVVAAGLALFLILAPGDVVEEHVERLE